MVDVITTTGVKATIRDEAIAVVTGPYPYDHGMCTYIRGSFGPGAFQAQGNPSSLVGRLVLAKPLTQLTRPTGDPVWVKASAVNMVRYPMDTELPDPGSTFIVRAVIMIGSFHQAIQEDVPTARNKLLADGLDIASLDGDHIQQLSADTDGQSPQTNRGKAKRT
jgi:hypothetical protein